MDSALWRRLTTTSCVGAEHPEYLLAIAAVDDERRWRRRGQWRRRVIAVPDFLRDIALPHVHSPVGVADTVVPNHRIVDHVAGPDRRIPGAPVTRPVRGVAPGPATRTGLGRHADTCRDADRKKPSGNEFQQSTGRLHGQGVVKMSAGPNSSKLPNGVIARSAMIG